MNIGLVTPYYPDSYTLDSGIANHYATLAETLAKSGHRVVVVHVRPKQKDEPGAESEQQVNDNIVVLTYKASLSAFTERLLKNKWSYRDFLIKIKCMLIAARKLNKIQKKYNLDVIETSSYFSLCYFYLLKHPKAPVAVRVSTTFLQMMDDYYPFKSRLYRFIGGMEIRMIRKSKHLITHAKGHANELEKLYHINAARFEIIPHGISLPEKQIAENYINRPLTILYAGRFEYRKGTDVLLAAIPIVLKTHSEVVFKLIGADPNNEYESNFRKLNDEAINRQVYLKGKLDTAGLETAYRDCDIFAAPSRYESFGLVFIEAMSCGKPVIGCPVGGVTDIITDEYNGLMAEAGNAADLAEKIIRLVEDTGLRKGLGANALATVQEKFTQEVLGQNSVNYYQSVVNQYN